MRVVHAVAGCAEREGLITLEQVMQDGPKIRALASSGVIAGRVRFAST